MITCSSWSLPIFFFESLVLRYCKGLLFAEKEFMSFYRVYEKDIYVYLSGEYI
jgi:hypothetical protein